MRDTTSWPDIAALAEADAAILVEEDVMRKGVAQRIVVTALRHAGGDAERVPLSGVAVAATPPP